MTVTVAANAKINLHLDVIGKRESGYHDVVSVMQSVSLYDTLTVTRETEMGISLDTGGALPADDSNLIVRAAKCYFAASGAPFGVNVILEKRIPMAAGMGGGSADAAAMLKALNELDGNRYTVQELAGMGAAIGADVPFCVQGGTCLCEGVGEILTPVLNNISATVVVAMGGEGVSTPAAFGALDRLFDGYKNFDGAVSPKSLIRALEAGNVGDAAAALFNRFEAVIEPLRPAVARIKRTMLQSGALAAQMSGSGPSVFGIFEDEQSASRAVEALQNEGVRAFVCKMI